MVKKQIEKTPKISTRQRLIELALRELDTKGLSGFDLDDLLAKSKISKGSLYHHFGSKNGLIIAAEIHLLLESYDQGNQLLRLLTENARNIDEFASHLELMVRTATNTESVEFRRRRVRALTLAQHNPSLAEEIMKSQIEGSNYLANTMQIAVDKGWLRPDIDVRAFSYFQQAVFFGHKLLDISGEGDLIEPWNEIAIIAFKAFLVQDK
jgi:AcrR family transcriptional regulator